MIRLTSILTLGPLLVIGCGLLIGCGGVEPGMGEPYEDTYLDEPYLTDGEVEGEQVEPTNYQSQQYGGFFTDLLWNVGKGILGGFLGGIVGGGGEAGGGPNQPKPDGWGCSAPYECLSGICIQGVCGADQQVASAPGPTSPRVGGCQRDVDCPDGAQCDVGTGMCVIHVTAGGDGSTCPPGTAWDELRHVCVAWDPNAFTQPAQGTYTGAGQNQVPIYEGGSPADSPCSDGVECMSGTCIAGSCQAAGDVSFSNGVGSCTLGADGGDIRGFFLTLALIAGLARLRRRSRR